MARCIAIARGSIGAIIFPNANEQQNAEADDHQNCDGLQMHWSTPERLPSKWRRKRLTLKIV